MAQKFILILVLAFCAVARTDMQLTGQPMECSDSKPVPGKAQLIDFAQLIVDIGGRGFAGFIDILSEISNLKVRIYYMERRNGDSVSSFSVDQGDLCKSMDNTKLNDNSPESNFLAKILELNPGTNCNPPLAAMTYYMDGVFVNQANLKGYDPASTYELEIEFETAREYSCIKLNAMVVADT